MKLNSSLFVFAWLFKRERLQMAKLIDMEQSKNFLSVMRTEVHMLKPCHYTALQEAAAGRKVSQ